MGVLREWRRSEGREERPRPRRWSRASRYGKVRTGRGGYILQQTVWGPDAPISRKGRRDLWILGAVLAIGAGILWFIALR